MFYHEKIGHGRHLEGTSPDYKYSQMVYIVIDSMPANKLITYP
jgi:hypothetical protein